MMRELTWVQWALVAVVHIGAVYSWRFLWDYRRSPWRETDIGRTVMRLLGALALLFTINVARFWWPLPGFDYVNLAVVVALVLSIRRWRRMLIIRQARSRRISES